MLAIRKYQPGEAGDDPQKRQPALRVHVDQTPAASVARVYKHLSTAEAEDLSKKRFQIINVWRPINHPAYDHPLTVCDYRSIDKEKDLVPTTLIYPGHEGENYSVAFNPSHAWKYLRGMGTDEVLLIKW